MRGARTSVLVVLLAFATFAGAWRPKPEGKKIGDHVMAGGHVSCP
jgi:hypothetical protein